MNFQNSISGEQKDFSNSPEANLIKSLNDLYDEKQKTPKTIHLVLFGKGQVGGSLIAQILRNQKKILARKNIELKIISIADSKGIWVSSKGFDENWQVESTFIPCADNQTQTVIDFVKNEGFENCILVDNTASETVSEQYEAFVENGFDIVSSNKIFNTLSYARYTEFRKKLRIHHKNYYYETNVGAGLPLIDNIRLLHLAGDNILRIRGVFSGSLSYIFNTFSEQQISFSKIVEQAMKLGFTEPDPRDDLSGKDVARKLLILARELDFENELSDVEIVNLIPENMRTIPKDVFLGSIQALDKKYLEIKEGQKPNHVLRYVGDLVWNQETQKGKLEVKLVSVPSESVLGRISGSDSIFEIYTESYGKNPIIIQGAGAGAEVTARGVFGDILKISEIKN